MSDSAALSNGLLAISRGGPDDSGVFVDEQMCIGLAYVRLYILNLSPLGHQPMMISDGLVIFVFDAEI